MLALFVIVHSFSADPQGYHNTCVENPHKREAYPYAHGAPNIHNQLEQTIGYLVSDYSDFEKTLDYRLNTFESLNCTIRVCTV